MSQLSSVERPADGLQLDEPPPKRQIVIALCASVAGWSLDLYDLFILLYVAPALGALFFPSHIPTLSLAAVYAAFAVSCVVRPFGSVVFGSYADKHGRKKTLLLTMGGVGVITSLMGVLPTIQQVGLLAPVLLLCLRVLQGLFVGGVVAATHTIGTETVPPSWRGWVSGAITGAGGGLGSLLASVVFLVISTLFPGDSFNVWGWRCMFFTGLLSALVAILLFNHLNESPFFLQLQKAKKIATKSPVKIIFTEKYRRITIQNILVVFGAAGMYYLTSGYMPTFLAVVNKLPKPEIATILVACGVVATLSPILIGQLSEMIGRRLAFIISAAAGLVLFGLAGFNQMVGLPNGTTLVACGLILVFIGNGVYAPVLIFLNERFPTAIRASGTAVCWNIGFAMGGLMPMFASYLSKDTSSIPGVLTWLLIALSVLVIVSIFFAKETRGQFE
jgi:MFS family permease